MGSGSPSPSNPAFSARSSWSSVMLKKRSRPSGSAPQHKLGGGQADQAADIGGGHAPRAGDAAGRGGGRRVRQAQAAERKAEHPLIVGVPVSGRGGGVRVQEGDPHRPLPGQHRGRNAKRQGADMVDRDHPQPHPAGQRPQPLRGELRRVQVGGEHHLRHAVGLAPGIGRARARAGCPPTSHIPVRRPTSRLPDGAGRCRPGRTISGSRPPLPPSVLVLERGQNVPEFAGEGSGFLGRQPNPSPASIGCRVIGEISARP